MKLILSLFLSLIFCIQHCTSQVDSILFLGNSYTYTADVPGKLKNLAASAGKTIWTDQYTPGGKQLSQHYSDPATLSKINSINWDFVVLQEQSQMPAINPNATLYYAQKIALEQIKANNKCTEVITYMTWARKPGNSWLTNVNWTHDEMAAHYEDFYEDIWTYVPGRVSAVGAAFHKATKEGYNIYSSDGSHQNDAGSYLAACVFYATIYKSSPVGLNYTTLDPSTTQRFQQIAEEIVLDKLHFYNISKARFSMSSNSISSGDLINFNESVYMEPFPNSFKWTFENAETTTSTQENPTGIKYQTTGTHTVSLEISNECGYSETVFYQDTIEVKSTLGLNTTIDSELLITTSKSGIHLQFPNTFKNVKITNNIGQTIKEGISSREAINFKGLAFITYQIGNEQKTIKTFVK